MEEPKKANEQVAALAPTEQKATTEDHKCVTFAELFAGQAGLTTAVQGICGPHVKVKDPHDELFGGDLAQDREFLEMVEEPAETAPDWKHMAPPCRTFTKARRKDKHASVKQLRSDKKPEGFGCEETTEANLLADRTAALGERQVEIGKWFSIENPEGSYIWELKSFKRLAKKPGVFSVLLHQCAYGAPWKKPTIILTNCPWLRKCLKCEDVRPHEHTILEGRVWSYKLNQEAVAHVGSCRIPFGNVRGMGRGVETMVGQAARERKGCQGKPDVPPPTYKKVGRFSNKLVRDELAEPAE